MDSIDVDGLRIGFERVGTGPPVVLLHGYIGDGPATWRDQLDALADTLHDHRLGRTGSGQLV